MESGPGFLIKIDYRASEMPIVIVIDMNQFLMILLNYSINYIFSSVNVIEQL